MNIRNHQLPLELVDAIHSKLLQREVGSWQLKSETDSFGNFLETELGELFSTEDKILNASNDLSKDFIPEGTTVKLGSQFTLVKYLTLLIFPM